jgi:catechol 2,3-dioxygenase-like lactoylglutathione lyase family enzyme
MTWGRRRGPTCMALTSVLAQSTVSDLGAAEQWYSALWGRGPDARPMPGLLEWHVDGHSGLQVWSEPDRAGRSTVVIGTDDLEDVATRLDAEGIDHGDPQPGGGRRILQLADPDGNRVLIAGS